MVSRSDNISARFLVPSTFLKVVAAKSRVEWLQSTNASYATDFPFLLALKPQAKIRRRYVDKSVEAVQIRVPLL